MSTPDLTDGVYTSEELGLASRNRGMPLELLRHDITPTGAHYLLIHWDIPYLDPATWSLAIGGSVANPRALTLADLRARPAVTMPVTLECAGNGRTLMSPRSLSQPWINEAIGTAEWTGVRLADLLGESSPTDDAVEFVFTGADRGIQGEIEQVYQRSLTIEDAMRDEVMLAYEMNGQLLEPQHGAPVRLLVPGWYGMTSVKWLTNIDAVTTPFEGYQQTPAYHLQPTDDDLGAPVQRIRVRALMIPPGFPDFPSRDRYLDAGRTTLRGRAWSGTAPVERVEVSIDGVWQDATLEQSVGRFAWRGWSLDWNTEPGTYALTCRATDADGVTQPDEPEWNMQGLGNNAIQRIAVTVR